MCALFDVERCTDWGLSESTIFILVRPSMGGIPYLMDFLDMGNEAHLRHPPKTYVTDDIYSK